MPSPKRPRKAAQKSPVKGMSVYVPDRLAAPLGGSRSTTFGQAIRCWARMLQPASLKMQERLDPAAWRFLSLACEGKEHDFDPDDAEPGGVLAQRVEDAVAYGLGKEHLPPDAALSLARMLLKLDYLHAWAVVWALQWRAFSGAQLDEEWWTLAHRRAGALGGNVTPGE